MNKTKLVSKCRKVMTGGLCLINFVSVKMFYIYLYYAIVDIISATHNAFT